jgi:predicted permease
MDWRSLGYAVSVAVATAVAFGLFPALQMTRGNLHESLKEGTRGNSARRSLLRSALVVVQVALALVALVGALLFVRTFQNLDAYNFGFDVKPLMTMRFAMPGAEYDAADAKLRRVQDVVEKVEALAGVQAAFASNYVPLSGGGGGGQVLIEGRPEEHGSQVQISFIGVTPHYLKTLSVPLISGRDFTDAEGFSHSMVAVINEGMAKKFWPDHNPVGARFRMDLAGEAGSGSFTVIGVARDTKLYGVDPEGIDSPTPVAFVPYAYQQTLTMGLTIRVAGDPAAITSNVRAALRNADPNLPLYQARTMDDQRRLNYWQYGLYGWISARSASSAAARGHRAYGVVVRWPSARRNRRARRDGRGREVLRLIIGYGLLLAGIGVAVGPCSRRSAYLTKSLLYNVSPFDPVTFTSVSVFLLAVAVLASWVPAIRATRVDPLTALRGE